MRPIRPLATLITFLIALTACAPADRPDPVVPPAAMRVPSRAIASFEMVYDRGQLYFVDEGRLVQAATNMPLMTQSSGPTGTTTPTANYVLLHQTMAVSSSTRDTACNSAPFGDQGVPNPFQGVCIPIQAISGYSDYILNMYVQLTSLAPCGTTTSVTSYVKSDSNSEIGVDNTLGLWLYSTTVYPAGDSMMRDRYTRNWYFATNQPGASACFRFTAVVMGQPWAP